MMPRIQIDKGSKWGMLTAIRPYGIIGNGKRAWQCRCECGNVVRVAASALHLGKSTSCGCGKKARLGNATRTHGMHGRPAYISWQNMWNRCTNKKSKSYKDYGGKEVKICKRWERFDNFFADMGERPKGKSLDRINPFGDYTPENCRWATRTEQNNNTRGHAALRLLAKMQEAKNGTAS